MGLRIQPEKRDHPHLTHARPLIFPLCVLRQSHFGTIAAVFGACYSALPRTSIPQKADAARP